jgi:hypothetical protein
MQPLHGIIHLQQKNQSNSFISGSIIIILGYELVND